MLQTSYLSYINEQWNFLHCYVFNFVVTSSYVLCLYLIPSNIRALPRNSPLNVCDILVFAATLCSLISVLILASVVAKNFDILSLYNVITTTMGIRIDNIAIILIATIGLMINFYLGPIVSFMLYLNINRKYLISDYGVLTLRVKAVSSLSIMEDLLKSYHSFYGDLIIFRNIIFAPISEEIVFRAVIIASLYIATLNSTTKLSNKMSSDESLNVALLSPIWFALAHIHHIYDKVRSGVRLKSAILSTSLQVTYTSIFGYISALLFMRTGSIFSSITSHMICNFIGLPDIGFMFSSESSSQLRSSYSCLYKYRYLLVFLHILGLILFSILLFPVTKFFAFHSFYWQE